MKDIIQKNASQAIDESLDAGIKLVRKINILCGKAYKSMTVDEFMLELSKIDNNAMTVKEFME
jgi:hypothetical protein